MTDTFSVTSERLSESLAVIVVSGEVDIYTAPRFKEHMLELLDAGVTDLVIDLTKVSFIDSTALGVLIGGVRRVNGVGGFMALVVVSRPVERVLSITAGPSLHLQPRARRLFRRWLALRATSSRPRVFPVILTASPGRLGPSSQVAREVTSQKKTRRA
jgi:anti-sigma B factor antagonist